jgi:transposase
MCQFYTRLDRGVFKLPEPLEAGAKTVAIDERVLDDLLDGIDVEKRPPRSAVH